MRCRMRTKIFTGSVMLLLYQVLLWTTEKNISSVHN